MTVSPVEISRHTQPSARLPGRRPVRLLLINPRFPESFWSFRWALAKIIPQKRTINPPLGLATLAALCPADWEVTIVDENIETVPLDPQADIVGVCGMQVQFPRQRELMSYFTARGHTVVAGGSYASLCPEEYVDLAETVVSGEAAIGSPVSAAFRGGFVVGFVLILRHSVCARRPAPLERDRLHSGRSGRLRPEMRILAKRVPENEHHRKRPNPQPWPRPPAAPA